jgi:hypothetical protein
MVSVCVSLIIITIATLIYVADGLQGHGIDWADQVCVGPNSVCSHSDWLMLSAFLFSLSYLVLKKDTV